MGDPFVKFAAFGGSPFAAGSPFGVGVSRPGPAGVAAARSASAYATGISWTAAPGVTTYSVYRAGSLLGTTANTTYTDTGGTYNTTYSWSVRALYPDGYSDPSSASAKTWPVFDEFTRTNDASSPGTAGSGQSWTNRNGTCGVAANLFYIVSSSADTYYATLPAGVADFTMNVSASSTNANLSLETQRYYFRWSDTSNYWAVQMGNGTALYIVKVVGGTLSVVASQTGLTINKGDSITLITSGTSMIVKQNGTERINYTDTANFNLTDTVVGLGAYKSGTTQNTRLDNFTVV